MLELDVVNGMKDRDQHWKEIEKSKEIQRR